MTDHKCLCKFCQFQPESNRVLYAIEKVSDIAICMASEDTAMGDFELGPEHFAKLGAELGVPVSSTDYVWEIAQRLQAR